MMKLYCLFLLICVLPSSVNASRIGGSTFLVHPAARRLCLRRQQQSSATRTRTWHSAIANTSNVREGSSQSQRRSPNDQRAVVRHRRFSNDPVELRSVRSVAEKAEEDEQTWDQLSIPTKITIGTIAIVSTAVSQFLQGAITGYFIGSVIGIPQALVTSKTTFGSAHSRSVKWAKSWGGTMAFFATSDTTVQLVRNRVDPWNEIFSAAIAGAWFGRKNGPVGAAKGALTWGGISFFVFSTLGTPSDRNNPANFEEHKVLN